MTSRLALFVAAACLLLGYRILLFMRRKDRKLLGLAAAYWFPFDRLGESAPTAGWIAAAVFSVPIFFAVLLFAREFRVTDSPTLGANMLGAKSAESVRARVSVQAAVS